ncbi:MAG TPA: molybdopterin cofactor-binding domain-containing protein [Rectinemataceae bacterium]|nr:molybdopterin cofactor-binding domain-containing protein [Rectinemataceae bacterium]
MKTIAESALNLRGATRYIDDLPEPRDCLQAAVRLSESARGRILSIDASAALALDPSVRVITARDVPGQNQIGFNKPDEPLLPAEEWEYWGQPVALVLARTRSLARRAAAAVRVRGENLPALFDPREAAAAADFILPSRTIRCGEPESAFAACAHVVSGRVDSGGQEHVYLETQGAYAEIRDDRKVFVISSTQGPTGVQRAVAQSLGLAMNMVEVEARRLGGGFGGKEDQAAIWGSLAALGAWVSRKPVKLYLDRRVDMQATGKRHPYSSDFRIGADADGRLAAFEADYYQNSGCTCDLSPAILSRTLLHATGAYKIPNVRVTGNMCRTNLPSFTAFRGFGAPQGFFVIEAALDALARSMGMDRVELQRRNLYHEGDSTYFGMPLERVRAEESFDRLLEKVSWKELRVDIEAFNASNSLEKRGAAILPLCFGISFTKLPMNQAGALVHVYTDGSVLVSTGAIEMGQQVSRKIGLIAASTLGIPQERVSVERTTTLTVANTVPTAASTGSDLNGMAAKIACEKIRARLAAKAASMLGVDPSSIEIKDGKILVERKSSALGWNELVTAANEARIDLSAHGFYSTPGLFYDMKAERGTPFAYHVYGAACLTARVDLVRATCSIESATIVHDSGNSLDERVDIGQIEGAFAQGLGWTLLEDLRFGEDGRPLSDTLSTYKLPNDAFLPEKMDIEFMPGMDNPSAPFNSKAVGEPPLQYGIAAYFAVLDALRAAKPDGKTTYDIPFIPEKIEAFLSGEDPC